MAQLASVALRALRSQSHMHVASVPLCGESSALEKRSAPNSEAGKAISDTSRKAGSTCGSEFSSSDKEDFMSSSGTPLASPRDVDLGSSAANMTPPASPRIGRGVAEVVTPKPTTCLTVENSSGTKTRRRDSKVSFFIDNPDLKVDEDSDKGSTLNVDVTEWVTMDDEDDDVNVVSYAFDDDSDEEGSQKSDWSNDGYDFDEEIVAALVKRGAEPEELTMHIEEAMAEAYELKVKRKTEPIPQMSACAAADHDYDVTTMMTPPGNCTPTESEPAEAHSPLALQQMMRQAVDNKASAQPRRSRASMASKGNGMDAISQAMQVAAQRHRRSLGVKTGDLEGEAMARAMQQAVGRHRQSISKAADVLDAAYGDNGCDPNQAIIQLGVVQQAMEEARRRHRRSISKAVNGLQEPPMFAKPSTELNACSSTFVPVAAALGLSSVPPGFAPQEVAWDVQAVTPTTDTWSTAQGAWDASGCWNPGVASTPAQRIGQAVQSAYNHHCYTQDQTWQQDPSYGYGYDYNGGAHDTTQQMSYGGDGSYAPVHQSSNIAYGAQSAYGQQATPAAAYGQDGYAQQQQYGQQQGYGHEAYQQGCQDQQGYGQAWQQQGYY